MEENNPEVMIPENNIINNVPEKEVAIKSFRRDWKSLLSFKNIGLLVAFIAVSCLFVYLSSFNVIENKFASQYRLVPEKISKSAAIKISLPSDFDMTDVKNKIKFEPGISGNWVEGSDVGLSGVVFASEEEKKTIVFKPNDPLSINRYYNVYLTLEDGQDIKADFLAVEDPVIEAVFPNADEETPEDSKITIVFSRPIVPLTTIDSLDGASIPIEITPETKGKYRWISTNTLQFQPENDLISSANYTVKIKDDFVSFDGIKIKGGEYKFKTRNLRYLSSDENNSKTVVYNESIKIYFNQPVDIKKTAAEMELKIDGKAVPFYISYAKKSKDDLKNVKKEEFGLEALGDFTTSTLESVNIMSIDLPNVLNNGSTINDSSDAETDKSVLEIRNKVDQFGREGFWNLQAKYDLSIKKAYPIEGDIILEKERSIDIKTTNIVKEVSVESERTWDSSKNLFDPQGTIVYDFYENIDINRSNITSSAQIDKIAYGEMCSEDSLSRNNCEKVENKKQIRITFVSNKIAVGSNVEIKLKEIYNDSGQKINIEERSDNFQVFKKLEISIGKHPYGNNTSELVLCSNNPLAVPEKKDFKSRIKTDLDYEIFYWNSSFTDSNRNEDGSYRYCPDYLFATVIDVGFMPEQNYYLDLTVDDVFGQTVMKRESFTTGQIENKNISIFSMQQTYSITSPKETILSFGVKNIDYVNLEICKQNDAESFYKEYDKYYSTNWNERYDFSNCKSLKEYEIPLPKKYWKTNYFDVDIKKYFDDPIGNYIVKIYNPDYKSHNYNSDTYEVRNIYSFLSVTNLAIGQKKVELTGENIGENESLFGELKNIYWVSNINTQEPIEGAKVKFYNSNIEGITNSEGLAFIKPETGLEGVIVEYGNDSTIIREYGDTLNYASGVYSIKRSYIYTDRPIYRPGDKVDIKGILRIGYDGNYQIGDRKIKVYIQNPRWDKVFEEEVTLNDFGTFLTSFSIDSDAPLGSYSVCTGDYNCSYFNVLEYAPAAFEVNASTSKDDFVSKEDVKIDLDVNYYFGVPVDNAEVEYTVSSQNYYFDRFNDWSYNFDYYDDEYYYSDDYYYGDKYLFRGKTTLDADGKGVINENIDLEKLFKNSKSSKIIIFDINVKNSFGQNVSYQKSVILHAGEFYLGSSIDPYFIAKNQSFDLKIKSVDIFGKNKRVGDINVDIYKTRWEYSKRQNSNGGYDYIWEKKLDFVKNFKASTDENGDYHSSNQKIESEGSYEVRISSTDSKGNKVYSNAYIYVHGDGQVRVRYDNDTDLELKSVKDSLKEGETGEIIIESPYPKAKALITVERGRIFEYHVVDVVGGLYSFKFKAEKKYAPNVYVSVLLHSPDPEVRFASKEFSIDSSANELNIELSADKKYYGPGDEVKMKVRTKDSNSNGIKAEVSLAVVDASVLALMGNPKKDPLVFFYNGFPLTVSTSSNVKGIIVREEIRNTKGGSGGGSEDSGKETARGEFKDTAFWKGDLVTNDDGYAEITFKLPDNLTRWQVEALGVTTDTKLGASYTEFVSRKELMIVPLKPRFIIPGDTFSIGAEIFNQSDGKKDIKVTFNSDSLIFLGDKKEVSLNLEKGESQTLYFSVKAPANVSSGNHFFEISADGGNISDAVKQKIVIRPNMTYETTATSNYTTNDITREAIYVPGNVSTGRGEVSVRASATLAVFLSGSVNYLIQYPYGCSEQLSSVLKGLATVEQALKVPNVADSLKLNKVRYDGEEYDSQQLIEIGLQKLFKNQNSDGGFSLWGGSESRYNVSLKVLDALIELNKAGKLKNDDSRLKNLINYVYNNFSKNSDIVNNPDNTINSAFNLLLVSDYSNDKIIKSSLEKIINDEELLKDKISNQSLAKLTILANRGEFSSENANKLNKLLDNRLNIDGRGAFIEPKRENVFWHNYETSIGDTSLYLRSLAAGKRETSNNDNVIRWLLNSRSKDESWGSTQNNIAVIEAFVDFLNWKKETESSYELNLSLNKEKIDSFSFTSKNIFEQFSAKIATNKLKIDGYNVIEFDKSKHRVLSSDAIYYDMSFKYYLEGDVDARDEGFTITREFYSLDDSKNKNPLAFATVGNVVRAHLEIIVPKERRFVLIEDYIPAGMEIVDMDLATEQKSLRFTEKEVRNNAIYPDFKELRDDRAVVYTDVLYPGVYEFDYYVRPLVKGNYSHLPAVISEMYTPEIFGRTRSSYFEIK